MCRGGIGCGAAVGAPSALDTSRPSAVDHRTAEISLRSMEVATTATIELGVVAAVRVVISRPIVTVAALRSQAVGQASHCSLPRKLADLVEAQ